MPQALRKGNLIAFISPSNRLNTVFSTRIDRAKSYFSSRGYPTIEIYTPALSADYQTSINQRCDEIHAAFANPSIKAIISTIGGSTANELLPYLDYALISANPKIFIGYSDMTILHHALYKKSHLRTFYGPAIIPQFGYYPHPQPLTSLHFFKTLTQAIPTGTSVRIPRSETWVPEWIDWTSEITRLRAREAAPSPPWKWLKGGAARGRLLGGCLPSLVQLLGSEYSLDYGGAVLLLETPESGAPNAAFPVEDARAALVDLRDAGVLAEIVGLVVGRLFMYSEDMVVEFEGVLEDVCSGFGFPVLCGVDVGHTDPVLTLPLGCLVALDSERDEFVLEESAVR